MVTRAAAEATLLALPRWQDAGTSRRPGGPTRLARTVEYATDAVILVGLAVALPFVILLVGAPIALAVRAVLWAMDWL